MIHRQGRWEQLSAIGAVAYPSSGRRPARVLLQTRRGAVVSADVVRFLRHLRRHIRGPVLLLWDGLHAHRSRETRAYLEAQHAWLTVERLPAYAPELNPVEGLWGWFKGGVVANLCPDRLDPIVRALAVGRRRLRAKPDLLRGFLYKAGLFI